MRFFCIFLLLILSVVQHQPEKKFTAIQANNQRTTSSTSVSVSTEKAMNQKYSNEILWRFMKLLPLSCPGNSCSSCLNGYTPPDINAAVAASVAKIYRNKNPKYD